MGVINSVLDHIRGLFGSGESTTRTEPGESYRCTICGTQVDGPADTCPLCGSTDVAANRAGSTPSDGLSGRPAERNVRDDTSTAASRLARSDPLRRFDDRWQRVEGGYRVSLPDGDRIVDSKDDVRAVLYRHDPDRRD